MLIQFLETYDRPPSLTFFTDLEDFSKSLLFFNYGCDAGRRPSNEQRVQVRREIATRSGGGRSRVCPAFAVAVVPS